MSPKGNESAVLANGSHWNPFGWIRRIYHWTLSWAEHRHGTKALGLVAFAEASFFPIPPDVLLMALGAAKPKRSLYYAAVCSLWSVAGGMAGYLIGAFLWGLISEFFFSYVFSVEKFNIVAELYKDNAFRALFLAAFTPIPFKVFTVAAGVFNINFLVLVLASVLGRSLRFFLVGSLLYSFGPSIKRYVEKYFEIFTMLFAVLLAAGFLLLKH